MIKIEENELFNERYRLISLLGVGGYSQVWLAEDTDINKEVALKIFATGSGLDNEALKTFSKEYSIVFDLNHPNLLIPKHFDKWEKMPYLVMPYIPKGSCLKLCGKMDEQELAKFLLQIGDALYYLHDQEPPIIHQDIKPDNILIDAKGNYLLTDFGISTKIRRTLTKSIGQKTASSGTTAYMAPEKFSVKLSDKAPIKANDIFSLGVCMFELLTDELPCGDLGGILLSSNGQAAELPENYAPNLQKLIAACLSKDAWERPTAEELVEVAKNYQKGGEWMLPERIAPSNPTNENNIDKAILAGEFERFVSHLDYSEERINVFFDHLNERYGNIDRVGFEKYLRSMLDDAKDKKNSTEVKDEQTALEKAIAAGDFDRFLDFSNFTTERKSDFILHLQKLYGDIDKKEFEGYLDKQIELRNQNKTNDAKNNELNSTIAIDRAAKTNEINQTKEQTPLERAIEAREFEKYYAKRKYRPTDEEFKYFHQTLKSKYGEIKFSQFMEICNRYILPKNYTSYWVVGIPIFAVLIIAIVVAINNGNDSYSSSGNSENSESSYDKGCYLFEQSRFVEAIDYFDAEIALNPNNFNAYFDRAICKSYSGDEQGCLNDYLTIISNKDSLGETSFLLGTAYNNLGWSYLLLGDLTNAEKYINMGLKLEPKEYYIWSSRGYLYYQKGMYGLAILDYNKAIELLESQSSKASTYNGDGEIYFMRGQVYIKLDLMGEACDDFNKALSLGYNEAKSKIAEYCDLD